MEQLYANYRLRDAQKTLARVERAMALPRGARPARLKDPAPEHARAIARVRAAHVAKAEADARAEIYKAEAREREAASTGRDWVRATLWGGLFAFFGIFPSDGEG